LSEVLHFRDNKTQWEPADVTVTILILSSVVAKFD